MSGEPLFYKCNKCSFTHAAIKFKIVYIVDYDTKTEKVSKQTVIKCPRCSGSNVVSAMNDKLPVN